MSLAKGPRPTGVPAPNAPPSPSFQPLYLQLKDSLLHSLEAKQWQPGHAIPSAIELAAHFGVSAGTVRKAIDALVADNIVVRRQGKGTFVATHTEEKASMFRFLHIRRSDGRDEYPKSRLIDLRRGKASVEIARALEMKPADSLFIIRRVLEYDGEPVVLDEISVSAQVFKGLTRAKLEAYPGSMYGFFETQFGVRMLNARERIRAIAADPAVAAILNVRAGEPLLAVERLARTYGGRPVEWRRGLCATRHHYYFNELG